MLLDVDPARDSVEMKPYSGRLEVGEAAVGEIPRVGTSPM